MSSFPQNHQYHFHPSQISTIYQHQQQLQHIANGANNYASLYTTNIQQPVHSYIENLNPSTALHTTNNASIQNSNDHVQYIIGEISDVNNYNDNYTIQAYDANQVYQAASSHKPQESASARKVVCNALENKNEPCRVCGETASTGLHYGTVTCEACKKFFLRNVNAAKDDMKGPNCTGNCVVSKATRANCPRCRYNKCIKVGMSIYEQVKSQSFKELPCQVCSAPSSGLHFGAVTCEGCKGFYRRHATGKVKLQCSSNGNCEINSVSRNACRACRFDKCIKIGMDLSSCKIGRQSNLFKQRLFNTKEQPQNPTQNFDTTFMYNYEKNFDIYTRSIIESIYMAYETHIEKNSQENFIFYETESMKRQIINSLEGFACNCATFMNEIDGFQSIPHEVQLHLLANSVHAVRYLWVLKQNRNMNYFNCDTASYNIIKEIFPVFNESDLNIAKVFDNIIKDLNLDAKEYALFTYIVFLSGTYFRSQYDTTKLFELKSKISKVLSRYMFARRNESDSFQSLMSALVHLNQINMSVQKFMHQRSNQIRSNFEIPNVTKNVYLENGFTSHLPRFFM